MYIVFDSNIWISELGLKSTLGAAIRFYLKRNDATLVIPEVIKLESERNLRLNLNEYISSIQKNHNNLLSIFGKLKDVVLPDEKDINNVIESLFSDLDVQSISIPFSLESAKNSFYKTIDKLPPSHKTQQFKDGVIWADCLSLLDKNDVHFVTKDKAFFEEIKYSKGLAKNLIDEAKEYKHNIYLYSDISELIESIKLEIEISQEDILELFTKEKKEAIDKMLERSGFEMEKIENGVISSFATESASDLYIEFELIVGCSPLTNDGRNNGKLILKGDCQLNIDANEYTNLRSFSEALNYTSAEGAEEEVKNVTLFASKLVMGHREIEHSVKFKLC